MNDASGFSRTAVFVSAFKCSIPVLLGYSTIGIAFGLLASGMGYPWYLAPVMSLWMYAGAGQFIALGLFAAGTSIWEACLIQLVVNARHIAYGLSMHKSFSNSGPFKPYLIFSLTDETFALLSSIEYKSTENKPENNSEDIKSEEEKRLFFFFISLLDQFYWVGGSLLGSLAIAVIPFQIEGIGFALTSLFVVLMIEQLLKVKKAGVFVFSGIAALAGVFLFPERVSILAALALALLFSFFLTERKKNQTEERS